MLKRVIVSVCFKVYDKASHTTLRTGLPHPMRAGTETKHSLILTQAAAPSVLQPPRGLQRSAPPLERHSQLAEGCLVWLVPAVLGPVHPWAAQRHWTGASRVRSTTAQAPVIAACSCTSNLVLNSFVQLHSKKQNRRPYCIKLMIK